MIGFRIDGRIVKSGALISNLGHLVPLGVCSMLLDLGLSDMSESKPKMFVKTL
jgi:hypothetical protein